MRPFVAVAVLLAACSPPAVEHGDVRFAPPALVATSPGETHTPPGTTPPGTTPPATTTDPITTTGDAPLGIDVSHWNLPIDWPAVAADGISWTYIKATEGTYYIDDAFPDEYNGSYDVGLVRGAYHFANPADSDGATQADYFVESGGGWSPDGQTLPGALDIEWNPYDGDDCYDLSLGEMTDWVADFSDEYLALTGRYPSIYSSRTYWEECISSEDFDQDPLWVANWGVSAPALPNGWGDYMFWQYGDDGDVAGITGYSDVDVFNGSPDELLHFAIGDWP
jgi:GH25 family lysozyme M1 (1,4-beta-N-acetylmuramidase)